MPDLPFAGRALFALYSFLIEVVVWIALVPAVCTRAWIRCAGPAELRQRLARRARRDGSPAPGTVVIHAVSVGEMHAAAPLVAGLVTSGRRVLLTTGNRAGLEAGQRLARAHSGVEDVIYLPWDRWAVRRWLAALAPAAVVVMETEIWPNLFRACAALDVPLLVANGRIRPRDVRRYRAARPFFAPVLACASWIGVQSAAERDRFLAIGAPASRLEVAGNVKFDAAVAGRAGMSASGGGEPEHPVIVAGSTHGPEERWLLDCARRLAAQGRRIRLVLAPRDVARASEVVRQARSLQFRARLWSEAPGTPWDVLVLDRYGMLREWYAGADVVVIGGTFAPIGGHNLLEPAILARPILMGPHTGEIEATVRLFDAADAVVRVPADDPGRRLAESCFDLLDDPVRARKLGENAAAVCRRHAGSAARYLRAIADRAAAVDRRIAASNTQVAATDAASVAAPSHGCVTTGRLNDASSTVTATTMAAATAACSNPAASPDHAATPRAERSVNAINVGNSTP